MCIVAINIFESCAFILEFQHFICIFSKKIITLWITMFRGWKRGWGQKKGPIGGLFYRFIYWYGKIVVFPWYKYNEQEVIMTLDRKEKKKKMKLDKKNKQMKKNCEYVMLNHI
jgi:hypothetical protein